MKIGIAAPCDLTLLADRLETPPPVPGLGSAPVAHLVRGLLAQGHQVILYTLDFAVEEPLHLGGPDLDIHVGAFRRRHRMRDLMAAERRTVEALIRRQPADIVSAHWAYEYALGALHSGLPTSVTINDWAPAVLRLKPDAYRLGRLLLFRRVLRQASHFLAPSPYIAQKVVLATGKPCAVVGQATTLAEPSAAASRQASTCPTMLVIANGFTRLKNTSTALRAFAAVRKSLPQARLLLVGDEHQQGGKAETWAQTHRLTAGVEFLGPLPNLAVRELLHSAHLLLHPSREESFGQAVLEALAAGLPVIGGHRSGAIPWLVGDAGYLCDIDEPGTIADAAIRLLGDEALRSRLSANARARVVSSFSSAQVAEAYSAEFERILATSGRKNSI
ncbi:glycosyltransferase family 4 protein [Radicibacter daui]|uniref:glycosyltransferase family 4 protein n=1 Tax=Radicibacter daui TaxID=3064829 RepID=UPI0040468C4C